MKTMVIVGVILMSGAAQADKLPVTNTGVYPLICKTISVYDSSKEGASEIAVFQGEIEKIYYGYTSIPKDEIDGTEDLDWFKADGSPGHEGVIEGPFDLLKPAKEQMPEIQVPAGQSVLYRVRYKHKIVDPDYPEAANCAAHYPKDRWETRESQAYLYSPN